MFITQRAEKESEKKTTTIPESASAHGIIQNATRYRALSKAGKNKGFESGSYPKQPDSDGSSWGWAQKHRFDPDWGYYVEED